MITLLVKNWPRLLEETTGYFSVPFIRNWGHLSNKVLVVKNVKKAFKLPQNRLCLFSFESCGSNGTEKEKLTKGGDIITAIQIWS